MHVIYVGYIRDVRNVGHIANISYVDYAQIVAPEVIPREKGFAGSQGKPAYQSNTYSDVEAWPSQEGNESGRVNRSDKKRSWQPAPSRSNKNPPAKMKRAKPPGFIFNPGPAPRVNPRPMTEAIRDPAHCHTCGKPNWTVLGNFLP
jgi:hypothetical protein